MVHRPTCPLASYLALESHPTSRKTSYSDIVIGPFTCWGRGKVGGTNRSDKGLNLSGLWQQGHSATYNTPSRI
ncbi:hypothetical protein R3W88_004293 [Solanum pinnatisectum]|uniref:Uncharacterized protein n=1 Tax=Solanum pinnatisectum TaxID=50273 RepID=A0AAV9K8V3_9SOLN|nr:hypothetical protein R3W88_004293 [Solanum pinnatisectum]